MSWGGVRLVVGMSANKMREIAMHAFCTGSSPFLSWRILNAEIRKLSMHLFLAPACTPTRSVEYYMVRLDFL